MLRWIFLFALLSWAQYNNYIEFGDNQLLQIQETSMRTPVAANIFLKMLEITINYQLQHIQKYIPFRYIVI